MADKLANVKTLLEETVYPVIRLRNKLGSLPYMETPFNTAR